MSAGAGSSRRLLRSVGWAGMSNWGSQLVLFVAFFVLSFILEPVDLGIVALADGVTAILALLATCGARFLVPQRRALPAAALDTLFWAALAGGALASAVLLLAAEPMAAVFGEPRLAAVVRWMALIPLLTAVSAVQEGVLVRQLAFRRLSARALGSNVVGAAVAIAAALAGAGLWSLVLQRLVTAFAFAAMSWAACDWTPSLRFHGRFARSAVRRGLTIVVSPTVARFDGRVYEYVIGYFLDAASVGYFRFAWRCYEFMVRAVSQPFSDVMLPALSRLRGDRAGFRARFRFMVGVGLAAGIPAFALAWAVGGHAIAFVFQSKWLASVPLFEVLCLAGVLQTLYQLSSTGMIALSRAATVLRLNLALIALSTVAAIVAVPINPEWVVWVHVLRQLLAAACMTALLAGWLMRAERPAAAAPLRPRGEPT